MAIQIEARRKSRDPWDIRLRAPTEKAISEGDEIAVFFWLRAATLPRGQDAGRVDVVVQRKEEPYDDVVLQEIQPGTDWRMYKVSGVANADFQPEETEFGFNLGKAKQTIEFGPFYAAKVPQDQNGE